MNRESIEELGLTNQTDFLNLNRFGAKFIAAGNDSSMFKFLQEYAVAQLDFE